MTVEERRWGSVEERRWGIRHPECSVKMHLVSNYRYTKIDEWLFLNAKDWFSESRYLQEINGPVAYDIFYFKHEEDKVKFILKWI